MRDDTAKAGAERPRRSKGRKRRGSWEEQPRREGMRRCEGAKALGERPGPLRRFLLARAGRPWDKIFSEICTRLSRHPGGSARLRDRIERIVAMHVVLIDGVPCQGDGFGYGEPLRSGRGWRPLYVCPKSGLLRRVKEPKQPQRPVETAALPEPIKVSATQQCHFLDGAWHLVTVAPLPQGPRRADCRKVDVVLNRRACEIPAEDAAKVYGAAVYATSKRRLAKRELRRWPIPAGT
jgi:hypothetical protein